MNTNKNISKFDFTDIVDYMDKITPSQSKVLLSYCNDNNIKPEICAWYEDREDFIDEWKRYGFPDTETAIEFLENDEQFVEFNNGEIVRLVV